MLNSNIIFYIILLIVIFIFVSNFNINKTRAHAIVKLDKTNTVIGKVNFEKLPDNNTRIYGKIIGLSLGKHGFHVHKGGTVEKGCGSLCGHYNPFNKEHGGRLSKERHVGDLGNLEFNDNKVCDFDFVDHLVKIDGDYNVVGRSIIIHEDEDDLGLGGHDDSKTTGHAGKRVACGKIIFK